ncbi:MAG: hypothetical protein NC418_01310 [Muribaculaceae bacterium]|nr:hypothetical protein [Muribaculaceae bacterium]
MKKLLFLSTLLMSLFALTSCDSDDEDAPDTPPLLELTIYFAASDGSYILNKDADAAVLPIEFCYGGSCVSISNISDELECNYAHTCFGDSDSESARLTLNIAFPVLNYPDSKLDKCSVTIGGSSHTISYKSGAFYIDDTEAVNYTATIIL